MRSVKAVPLFDAQPPIQVPLHKRIRSGYSFVNYRSLNSVRPTHIDSTKCNCFHNHSMGKGTGVAQAGVGSSSAGRNAIYPASLHGLRQQEGSQRTSPSVGAQNWALCSPNSKVGWTTGEMRHTFTRGAGVAVSARLQNECAAVKAGPCGLLHCGLDSPGGERDTQAQSSPHVTQTRQACLQHT